MSEIKVNKKTNEVYCNACGNWTFSNSYARYKRLPLQCPKCKKYFQSAKRLK